ncbi:hypothetical protein WMC41_16110 [Shinella yambaruensis]|uniref:hypothetical protein n=1 Tax=Shinella yambaruensis TaxID=415996 RepID=UPI003D7BEE45
MISAKNIMDLLDIANRALVVDTCEQKRRKAQRDLSAAYDAWKTEHRIRDHMEAGSPEMERMLTATEAEYDLLTEAKRDEANARKRLQSAIRKYRKQG